MPQNPEMRYTDEEMKQWADDPEKLLSLRKAIETSMLKVYEMCQKDSDLQAELFKKCSHDMHAVLSKKEALPELLIPKFGVGCRRQVVIERRYWLY
jgi:hypothetical protein